MNSPSLMQIAELIENGTIPGPFEIERAEFIPDAPITLSLKEVLPEFRKAMRSEYPTKEDYPYHNWDGHILSLEEKAKELIKGCRKLGMSVNEELVLAIIYSHDARFHFIPEQYGAQHKEQIAGHFAYATAKRLGCSEEDARLIEDGVFSSHSLGNLNTVEKKIARAADLHNVGGEKEGFFSAFGQLYQEHIAESRILGREPKRLNLWKIDALNFLGTFLLPLIELTPNAQDSQGRSQFHINALKNIISVNHELNLIHDSTTRQRVIAQIGGSGTSNELLGVIEEKDVVIRCSHLGSIREQMAEERDSIDKSLENIFLPTHYNDGIISIPDASCDITIVEATSIDVFPEIVRITKPGGKIIVCISADSVNLSDMAYDNFRSAAIDSGLKLVSGNFEISQTTQLKKAVA